MDLLIRAGHNDHTVVRDLCAPVSAGLTPLRRLPLSAVVADANTAASEPSLRKTTSASGMPFLIDPVTPLLQDRQDPDASAWARLPFATAEKVPVQDLTGVAAQDRLVEQVLDFQRGHGATHLIPPYLYSAKLGDAASQVNLALLRRAARYLKAEGVRLPVVPVLALSLTEYAPAQRWDHELGLDRYLDAVADLDTHYAALSWSTSTPGKESFSKITHLLAATRHAASRVPVIGWRQGLYGPALLAAGAAGYETGAGTGERCHYPDLWGRRRPVPPEKADKGGGGGAYVYLATFGRSLPRREATALLQHPRLLGSLVCADSAGCCPDGVTSMVTQWRQHAIRNRARQVERLERMPSGTWRLHDLATAAQRSLADARVANAVLEAGGHTTRLPEETYRSLGKALDLLRGQAAHAA